jgi:hypothetical protein
MLLLLGNAGDPFFPFAFRLAGVIVPKSPPCFAIPYFDYFWWHGRPLIHSVIQDVANEQVVSFARVSLEVHVKTIKAKHIHSVVLASGEYSLPRFERMDDEPPMVLNSFARLFAFADSFESVLVGHLEPLRRRLSQKLQPVSLARGAENKSNYNDDSAFSMLEMARFCRDRNACLTSLKTCFESLGQHNRALAVHWLKMTKDSLKIEGILESSD